MHTLLQCLKRISTRDTWLAFTWDGVGYGEDGTLWGGEAFLGQPGNWQRVATMRSFRLPGGERAGREPWRSAAALCWETNTQWAGIPGDTALLHNAWLKGINAPQTTAVGRLFDAAAALTGVCSTASFEGQGPMHLEALAGTGSHDHRPPPVQKRIRPADIGLVCVTPRVAEQFNIR